MKALRDEKNRERRKNKLNSKILEIFHLKKLKEKETTTEQMHFRQKFERYIL